MPRGGYQKPSGGPRVAGPGAASRRTDAGQPARAPDLDVPGQQYGDRQMQEAAQRAVPLPVQGQPAAEGMAQMPVVPPRPSSVRGRSLSNMFDMDSTRPNEALTTGLERGPGAGSDALANPPPQPDERSQILAYVADLARTYSPRDADEIMQSVAQARQPDATGMMMGANGRPGGIPAPSAGQGLQEPPGVGGGQPGAGEEEPSSLAGESDLGGGPSLGDGLDLEDDLLAEEEAGDALPPEPATTEETAGVE